MGEIPINSNDPYLRVDQMLPSNPTNNQRGGEQSEDEQLPKPIEPTVPDSPKLGDGITIGEDGLPHIDIHV